MRKIATVIAAVSAVMALSLLSTPSFAAPATKAGIDIFIGVPGPGPVDPYDDPYYVDGPYYDAWGRPYCVDYYGYRVPCRRSAPPVVIPIPIPITVPGPGGHHGEHHHPHR